MAEESDDVAAKKTGMTDDGITVPLSDKKLLQDLWAKQEDIAMHFNDLTMRLRLQALAGVGAAVVAAGTLLTHEGVMNLRPVGGFLVALAIVWSGIYALDAFYYQELLRGAVDSVKEIEEEMPIGRLSTRIAARAKDGEGARRWFYAVVGLALVAGAGVCLIVGDAELVRSAKKETAPAPPGSR